jgi:hypothetical protein
MVGGAVKHEMCPAWAGLCAVWIDGPKVLPLCYVQYSNNRIHNTKY